MAINNSIFVIADRTIALPLNIKTFGVVGDANSKVVEFRTNRYVDGVDLSTKEIFVCYKNAVTETGETACTDVKFTTSALTFNWVVPAEVVSTTGNIEFYVEFRTIDADTGTVTYRLRTKAISQFVEDTFDIQNDISTPDTYIIDSWLKNNATRIDRVDLIDSDVPFKVEDRTILFNPTNTVAMKNDSLSQSMTFRLKKVVDGIDRSDMTFGFAFKNAEGKTGIMQACNIMSTEDEIFVSWALENVVTQTAGVVEFFILVIGNLDNGDRYSWNTKTAKFTVEDNLDIDGSLEIPTETWFETFMLEVDNAVRQASIHANEAKEQATSVKNIAITSTVNTGTVITHLGTTAPTGYLVCDGTEYNVSDYTALANHIEAQFGTVNHFGGDGTTFAVPTITATTSNMIHCIKY